MPPMQSAGKGNTKPRLKRTNGVRCDANTSLVDQAIRLAQEGRYAESEACSRRALRLRPDDVNALNELRRPAVWRQGRAAEFRGDLNSAPDRRYDPTISGFFERLGARPLRPGAH